MSIGGIASAFKDRIRAQNDPKKQGRSFEINRIKFSKENSKGLQLKKQNEMHKFERENN